MFSFELLLIKKTMGRENIRQYKGIKLKSSSIGLTSTNEIFFIWKFKTPQAVNHNDQS